MSHRLAPLLVAACAASALAPSAFAAGPDRWRLAQEDPLPLAYFQGLTHASDSSVLFIGPFDGAYRTDTTLAEQARVDTIYPPDVGAIGFNHAGDPTYDASQGGRLLAPMECYRPDLNPTNTCGMGGFGVLDPVTLAWRYWVRLDPADIPKAMWAEVSPDGKLVWTSAGNDLLAYSTADISPANAATGATAPPIHPVRRLAGAVPPSGVTGAVFVGGRLLLAGEADGLLQVRSVDLSGATPTRIEIELPGVSGESEGLDLIDMRGGTLHWILSPAVAKPTFGTGHTELLTFLPTEDSRLRLSASRRGSGAVAKVRSVYGGASHAVAGATVRVGKARAKTDSHGVARFAHVSRKRQRLTATKLQLLPGAARLAKRR